MPAAMESYLPVVETPLLFSIVVTRPVSGSKNFLFTTVQPPRSLIVNRCAGVGNLSAPGVVLTTGR